MEVNSRTFRPRRSSSATKLTLGFVADEDLRGLNILLLNSLSLTHRHTHTHTHHTHTHTHTHSHTHARTHTHMHARTMCYTFKAYHS